MLNEYMASSDEKLDKLLEDVAIIRVVTLQHTEKLKELEEKLVPVFFQINGIKWAAKVFALLIGAGTCIAAVIPLLKPH